MKFMVVLVMAAVLTFGSWGTSVAATDIEGRIEALEKQVQMLSSELGAARAELEKVREDNTASDDERVERIAADVEELKNGGGTSVVDRFRFGGYGEMHANFVEGGADLFDIHRLVLYMGYDFADWIKLDSEVEVEHAYVSTGSGGELNIEQLHLNFLLDDRFNVRAGRMLAPLGITNQRHEPPSFNGVERPSFDKVIIPTTWSVDGIGAFGNITDKLSYQAYVVTGLDGSKFSATDGIRNGRIKEQPSLNDIAYTGRLDYYPLMDSALPYGQDLRLGASIYHGGINNGNKGKDPGVRGSVTLYSSDLDVSLDGVDIKGALAYTSIRGTGLPAGVAEATFGYMVEAGYHFWPESFKTGKLERSDAVVFARLDDYDTQFSMPAGVAANPAGDRQDITFGINFYPVPNLVIKADYQLRDSNAPSGLENLLNVGIGWQL